MGTDGCLNSVRGLTSSTHDQKLQTSSGAMRHRSARGSIRRWFVCGIGSLGRGGWWMLY